MTDGFIKAAAATPEIRVADCAYNAASICALAEKAAKQEARLLVLPELCVTGYTCGDLFFQQALLDAAKEALKEIRAHTRSLSMLLAVGLPLVYEGKLYNCAALLFEGRILGVVPKTYLPNYGEFYEKRYFTSAHGRRGVLTDLCNEEVPFGADLLFCCQSLPELTVAVEICEDLWAPAPPSARHAAAGATVILNLSASDEIVGKAAYRRSLVRTQSARLVCGYLYAGAGEGESTGDLVFASHNLIAENGALLAENPPFGEGLAISDIDVGRLAGERRRMTTFPCGCREGYQSISFPLPIKETPLCRAISPTPFIPGSLAERQSRCEDILGMQSHGLKKRIIHSQAKTAVIGVSGGLDSALALLVAVRTMGLLKRPRTDIEAITMPCFGTTQRTKGNAELLCERLGVNIRQIDIKAAVEQHFKDIGQDSTHFDVTFENAQARERTQVLMDVANLTGGLVVGTGDLSELALGWATYNGDHMSMYGVNASVPKTLVRYLVAYEAERCQDPRLAGVLMDILDTPVSPELLPPKEGKIQQKTEDLVGPYELHDFFLYYCIRWAFPPKKVFRLACRAFAAQYNAGVILKWLENFYRRFFAQQFKRSCLPDGPKIGSVALSPRGDWRMPSDAAATVWLAQLKKMRGDLGC